MQLYAKAEEGIQTVLQARAAKETVASAIEAAQTRGGNVAALETQAAQINQICDDLEGSMMPVGTTMVQIINERSKLVPKLTWLHDVLDTSEGPPNSSTRKVYDKVAGEMDAAIAQFNTQFNTQLNTAMAEFERLSR
jgi:hypothetical protein